MGTRSIKPGSFPPSDRALWEIHLSSFHYPVLLVADELNLFSALAKSPRGVKAPALGKLLHVGPLFLECALGTLCALGFLQKKGPAFHLTPVAKTYLLPDSPYYWGGMLAIGRRNSPLHAVLGRAAREEYRDPNFQRDALVDAWATGTLTHDQAKTFTRAMDAHTRAPAEGIAKDPAFRNVKKLLDLGAGSGCVSVALAKRWPFLQATLLDFPMVCEEARHYVGQAKASVSKRIAYHPGNFFNHPWPAEHDATLFANILHDWGRDQCTALLRKAHAVLPSSGKVFILEMLLDNHLTGPLATLGFSTNMLTHTRGKQFSRQQLDELLKQNGFQPRPKATHFGYYSLVVATKITRR